MDSIDSNAIDALLAQGETAFAAEDLETAGQCFADAIKLNPRSSRAWCDMGAVQFQRGNLDEASDAFRDAAQYDPTNTDALANAAEVELALNRPEEAAPFARDLLALNAGDEYAFQLLQRTGVGTAHRPTALVVDWKRSLGPVAADIRAHLSRTGWFVPKSDEKLVRLTTEDEIENGPALIQWLNAVQPSLVVMGSEPEAEPSVAAWCNEHEVLMVNLASTSTLTSGKHILCLDPNSESALDELVSVAEQAFDQVNEGCDAAQAVTTQDIEPILSVIAPTYERAICLRNLLDRLALQDIPPHLFEVIIVDDGSKVPVTETFADFPLPYRCQFLTQKNAGPGAARNRAIAKVRGKYLLILNDDAVPACDNLRRHIIGQLQNQKPCAILGTFDFDVRARRHVFTDLMQNTSLLFNFVGMTPGGTYDWKHFWTCNISLPTEDIRAVNGFDEEFRHAICEDVEIGIRLQQERQILVRYDPRIRARHDHDLDLSRYEKRHLLLGKYQRKLMEKHPKQALTSLGIKTDGELETKHLLICRRALEFAKRKAVGRREKFVALEKRAEAFAVGTPERQQLLTEMKRELQLYGGPLYLQGILDKEYSEKATKPSLRNKMTSVIMPNLNGFPHIKVALDSLRRNTQGPFETIVIDNGSKDGSLEWLREQSDVTLIELGSNLGAPAARNAGLQIATGETICFCDNDVIFTPGWREIHINHLEAWPDIGVVGPMSDYVTGGQKTEELENKGESLDDFATRFHEEHANDHLYTARLILFFMVCRREVIEEIGGIDARYRRWGFEDDDFALRALIAGYQLRIAKDCYIRHIGSQTSKTAKIDYNALLLENWEVFKRRWDMDTSLPYGTIWDAFTLANRPFDKARDYVPLTAGLPEVSATV